MRDQDYGYDPKCAELAMAFLDNQPEEVRTPAHRAALAQQIQDTIEAYLLGIEVEREAAGGMTIEIGANLLAAVALAVAAVLVIHWWRFRSGRR